MTLGGAGGFFSSSGASGLPELTPSANTMNEASSRIGIDIRILRTAKASMEVVLLLPGGGAAGGRLQVSTALVDQSRVRPGGVPATADRHGHPAGRSTGGLDAPLRRV